MKEMLINQDSTTVTCLAKIIHFCRDCEVPFQFDKKIVPIKGNKT